VARDPYFLSAEEYPPRSWPRRSIIGAIRGYADAGSDEVYVSQIGGNAGELFDFYAEVLPPPADA
jgi:hypothetical protein